MTIQKKYIKVIVILLPMILIFGCCYYIFEEMILKADDPLDPEVISSTYGAYEYNPHTVLENIHTGNNDIFRDIEYEIGMNEPRDNMEITPFTDEELYQISRYLLENYSDSDSEEWKLVEIYYTYHNCSTSNRRIVSASFAYERTLFVDGEKLIELRGVEITTFSEIVIWSEKIEKRDSIRKTIDWRNIIYYPENVVKIAETNGGNELHQKQNNNCGEIILMLFGHDRKWSVNYYDNEDWMNIFSLEVDSKTGKVRE